MTVAPFKWITNFVLDNARVQVVVEVSDRTPAYVGFTGTFDGGGGQIVDRLRAAANGQAEIIELCDAWDALHFTHVDTLTPQQAAYLDSVHVTMIMLQGERYGEPGALEELDEATFTAGDDRIDSRDVIRRLEEVQSAFEAAGLDPLNLPDDADQATLDAAKELAALKALDEEASGYAEDWQHGETLIRESSFASYAEEIANDIGAINRDAKWPLNHIDWDAAADELKLDYTTVTFDGVEYLIR